MKKKVQWAQGVVPHRVAVRKNPPKVEWQKKPLSEELKYQPYYTSDDASDIRPGDLFVLQDKCEAWILNGPTMGYYPRRYPVISGRKNVNPATIPTNMYFLYVGQHSELTSSTASDSPVLCVFPAFLMEDRIVSIPHFKSLLQKVS